MVPPCGFHTGLDKQKREKRADSKCVNAKRTQRD